MRCLTVLIAAILGSSSCFLSCVTVQRKPDQVWTTLSSQNLAFRMIDHTEITARFGQGAENNPFIASRGLFFGGAYFSVFEVWNIGNAPLTIDEAMCFDTSDLVVGKLYDPKKIIKYWEVKKDYLDTLDAKRYIVDHNCLSYGSPLLPTEKKIIVIFSEKEPITVCRLVFKIDGIAGDAMAFYILD